MPRKVNSYSVADAARALDMRRQSLERLLRTGNMQFGFYIPPEKQGGQGSYYVYRKRVEAYINALDLIPQCKRESHESEVTPDVDTRTEDIYAL